MQVAEQFERDLEYLGITGVRDKLQAYVPETLELMMEAGIRVWIATGMFDRMCLPFRLLLGTYSNFVSV